MRSRSGHRHGGAGGCQRKGRRAAGHRPCAHRGARAVGDASAAEGVAPQRPGGPAAAPRSRPGGQGRRHRGPLVFAEVAGTGQESDKKYHVGLAQGGVGEYVLVPGDPGPPPTIAQYLDDAKEVAFSPEYRTFTGSLDGVQVTPMSTVLARPSAPIRVN